MVQNTVLLVGANVLLVEDEVLIAMDVEQMLDDLGAGQVRQAASVVEALRLITALQPTVAVLDLGLGSETSSDVADELAVRGVPFLFVTGYSGGNMIPAAHASVPVVDKPVDEVALEAAIAEVMGKSVS